MCLNPLRTVSVHSGTYVCDKCYDPAVEVDGVCVCPERSVRVGDHCECSVGVAVYSDYSDPRKCLPCPVNCNCSDVLGCYYCENSTRRSVINKTYAYNICPCDSQYIESDGVCSECSFPLSRDSDGICSCSITSLNNCSCTALGNQQAYYFDSFSKLCLRCPLGCDCTSSGCSSCTANALRVNIMYQGFSVCPCIQSAIELNGVCRKCA